MTTAAVRLLLLAWIITRALSAFAYEGGVVEDGATIRGTVRLNGPVPKIAPRQVFNDLQTCGSTVEDESLVLGPGKEIRYAVVTLEGIARGKPVETAFNVVEHSHCRYVPHVIAASAGQWLLFANSDPILHYPGAISIGGREALFNYTLPPEKQLRYVALEPGVIRVSCNVRHAWMDAYVVVADHPYIAVTDAKGAYEISDVPPGRYTLKVWHERLGLIERPVTVETKGRYSEDLAYLSRR